jgi:preprotein translocase subunit SecB
MADSDASGATQGGAQQASAQQAFVPPLALNVQYVKDLSFENPGAPNSLVDLSPPPNINVDVNVETSHLQDRAFEVLLHLRASASRGETTFFVVELSYGGVCTVGAGVPDEHISPLVAIEGPRMLFPFARAVVADCVRDGGFPPLLINPIDFSQMYRQAVEAHMAQQQAAGDGGQPGPAERGDGQAS